MGLLALVNELTKKRVVIFSRGNPSLHIQILMYALHFCNILNCKIINEDIFKSFKEIPKYINFAAKNLCLISTFVLQIDYPTF